MNKHYERLLVGFVALVGIIVIIGAMIGPVLTALLWGEFYPAHKLQGLWFLLIYVPPFSYWIGKQIEKHGA